MQIVDRAGKYRIVKNGFGGYAFEVLGGGKWHRFGNETSDRYNADTKLKRLAGLRDTATKVSEWEAFYRVNV